jgi:HSP20 family protein
MTLVKFNPFKELETLSERMRSLFDDLPTAFNWDFTSTFYPRVDISEDENNVYVTAELPGVDKKDVKVTLQDNVLTIEGEKKSEVKDEKKNYYRIERTYGSFCRSFALPAEVDPDKVKAKFENGMLMIEAAKKEPSPANKKLIEIK